MRIPYLFKLLGNVYASGAGSTSVLNLNKFAEVID
jgi:hypothetical protein